MKLFEGEVEIEDPKKKKEVKKPPQKGTK